jgi:hypothetical protein
LIIFSETLLAPRGLVLKLGRAAMCVSNRRWSLVSFSLPEMLKVTVLSEESPHENQVCVWGCPGARLLLDRKVAK